MCLMYLMYLIYLIYRTYRMYLNGKMRAKYILRSILLS